MVLPENEIPVRHIIIIGQNTHIIKLKKGDYSAVCRNLLKLKRMVIQKDGKGGKAV